MVKRSKTSPFHGGNTGSIPVGVIRKPNSYTTIRASADSVEIALIDLEYSIVGSKNHTRIGRPKSRCAAGHLRLLLAR